MKNILAKAQEYMDAGRKVPEELIAQMTAGEREILEGITGFQADLTNSLDTYISDKPITFKAGETGQDSGIHPSKKTILIAAALFACAAGIPLYRSVQTTQMLKEETRNFVASITAGSWNEELLVYDTISSDWFNSDPLLELF